jgi:serine/threonine-protein kinase
VIAFECLVGQRPFNGETLGTLVLEICSRPLPVPSKLGPVPKGFDAWFAKACARDPAARFASAREAAAELRRICQPRGSATEARETARPTNAPERSMVGGTAARTVGRRWLIWLILGACAIVGVGAAVFALRGPAGHAPTAAAVPTAPVSAPAPPRPPGPAPPATLAPAVEPPAPAPPPREPKAAEPTGRSPISVKPSPPRGPHHAHADKASATPARKAPSAAVESSKPAPTRPAAPATGEKPKVNLGI